MIKGKWESIAAIIIDKWKYFINHLFFEDG